MDDDAKAEADARQARKNERWAEQAEIGKSRHEDWDAVIAKSAEMEAEELLVGGIEHSDFQGELVYHLATHPEDLKRINNLVKLPANADDAEIARKTRVLHRELDRLEGIVSGAGANDSDDEPEAAAEKPVKQETAKQDPPVRENRPAAAAPPPAAKVTPKAKPEPIRPVGKGNGAIRQRRLQDLSSDEAHAMQVSDPDGFRKLVEAAQRG